MKTSLLVIILLSGLSSAMASDSYQQENNSELMDEPKATYCLGGFYSQSYSFSSNYAFHCGFSKKRTYLRGKNKGEVKDTLAAKGINYIKTNGTIDIYKVGFVNAEDKQIQILTRLMVEDKNKNALVEYLSLENNRYKVNYKPQVRSADDYSGVREAMKEFNQRHVGTLLYGRYAEGATLQDIRGTAYLVVNRKH